jgi:hypothetical protein
MEIRKRYRRQEKAAAPAAAGRAAVRIPVIAWAVWLMLVASGIAAVWLQASGAGLTWVVVVAVGLDVVDLLLLFSLKVADQWEKAVVLRIGRFSGLRGPGFFINLPVLDAIPMWIDHRSWSRPSVPKRR